MRGDGREVAGRYLVAGPVTHGVVLHGLRLARADPRLGRALVRLGVDARGTASPQGLQAALPAGGSALVQVTDRLFGATPEAAADVVTHLAARATLGLVLHDVPQPAEGADWYARRRAAYGRLASVATQVVVASAFEADLLTDCVGGADRAGLRRRTTVIPLPVQRRPEPVVAPAQRRDPSAVDLAVLGFLYPGKGLEEAIDIAAALSTPAHRVTVTNYGAPAEGHADHVDELQRYAAARGVRFRVTGYLSDDDLHRAVLAAGVPLAPHRHISASGSVNTWVESGRRPVVRRSPYVTELDARMPGAVTPADDLLEAVSRALTDPATTWLAPDVTVGPSWAAAAAAHAEVLDGLVGLDALAGLATLAGHGRRGERP